MPTTEFNPQEADPDFLRTSSQMIVEQSMNEVNSKEVNHKIRNLGRKALAGATMFGLTIGVMSSYNKDVIREQLIFSDLSALISPKPQIEERYATPTQSLNNLIDIYSIGNGLYRDEQSPISGTASAWHLYETANAEDLESMLPGKDQAEAKTVLSHTIKISQDYNSNKPSGYKGGYDPNLHLFPFEDSGRYVDDNLWWGILFADEAKRTDDLTLLKLAERSYRLAASQWNDKKGGIAWKEQLPGETNHARALVSNAPFVILALKLAQNPLIKNKDYYINWAKKDFKWLNDEFINPQTALYIDHVGPEGKPDMTIYSYGQGVVIGALKEFNAVDPNEYPLINAVNLANTSMSYLKANNSYGTARYDAIYLRELMSLAAEYDQSYFTQKVIQTQKLIKKAMPNYPTDLKGAASDTAINTLAAMPFDMWQQL